MSASNHDDDGLPSPKAANDDRKRLAVVVERALATTAKAKAAVEARKPLNDPESVGRARVAEILLCEEAAAQWGDIARFIASQKRAMDVGAADARSALAQAMEQHEAEFKEHGVIVDVNTQFHVVTLAAAVWAYEVVDENLLPDDVFTRKYDRNKIEKLWKEKGGCPGVKRKKGKRYVKIRLRGETTPRRSNGRNEEEEQGQ